MDDDTHGAATQASPRADEATEWELAGQIPQEQGAPAIEIVRPLSAEELAGLDAASELLVGLAAQGAYGRAVDLLRAAERQHDERLSGDRRVPPAALVPLAKALAAVSVALLDVPAEIIDAAARDLSAEDVEALTARVAELHGEKAWRIAVGLGRVLEGGRSSIAVSDGALVLSDDARRQLSGEIRVEVDAVPVLALLVDAVLVAQSMTAHRLLSYAPLVEAHGLFVKRLAAEVPLGVPVAIRGTPTAEGSRTLSFKDFPLDRIHNLYIAIRMAAQVAAAEQPSDADVEPEGYEGRDADAPKQAEALGDTGGGGTASREDAEDARRPGCESADEAEVGGDGVGPDDDHHRRGGVDDDAGHRDDDHDDEDHDGDVDGDEDAPEEILGDFLPLDFDSLVAFAERLPTAVERAWSKALDGVDLDDAHVELNARLQTVLMAVARRAQLDSAELATAGVDPRLPFRPDDPRVIHTLELSDDTRARWHAATMGQMTAAQQVAAHMRRLIDKEADASIRSPEDPHWWEAGAFAQARGWALTLRRTSAEVREASAALLGEPGSVPASGAPQWSHRLRLAEDARDRGDAEAAVLHLWLAVRDRAAQLAGIVASELDDAFEDRLDASPDLRDLAPGFTLLRDLAKRALSGAPAPLGYYTVAAALLVDPLRRVCSTLSRALPDAARDPGTGS